MVEFKDLWYGHPLNQSVVSPCLAPFDGQFHGSKALQNTPTFANQCAIRMGVALKNAGLPHEVFEGRCLTCAAHGPEAMHFIRAQEVADALADLPIRGVGERLILKDGAPKDYYPELYGRTGIIYIKDYWHRKSDRPERPSGDHIDVWNGYRSSAKWLVEWFSWLGYYSNYSGAREIWFWPVE